MTCVSLNNWRYVLANSLRGFLHYEHSHSRIVYGSLRAQLENCSDKDKSEKVQNVLEKLRELDKSNEIYSSGKYFKPENRSLADKNNKICQELSKEVLDIAPKNVLRLLKIETILVKKGIISNEKSYFDKLYNALYAHDKNRRIFFK